MKVLNQLTNKQAHSASLAAQLAKQRDEASSRVAEIGALVTKAAALDEEIRAAVVAAALDGIENTAAIAKYRAEHRAVLAQAEALTERNQTAALVIAELQRRENDALVGENVAARRKLADEFDVHAVRVRALLLEASTHQEMAQRARRQEGELACAVCVQGPGGLPAASLIEFRPLGPPLANLAQAFEAIDTGNNDLARLMKVS